MKKRCDMQLGDSKLNLRKGHVDISSFLIFHLEILKLRITIPFSYHTFFPCNFNMQVSQRPFKYKGFLLKSEETLNLKSTGSIFMFHVTALCFPFCFLFSYKHFPLIFFKSFLFYYPHVCAPLFLPSNKIFTYSTWMMTTALSSLRSTVIYENQNN